jgi:hypothetical protein
MIHQPRKDIPENHPLRNLFRTLTERGMGQLNHRDQEVVHYLTDLLTEFAHRDNLNRIATDSGERLDAFSDMLDQSAKQMLPETRRAYFKHVGDVMLFNLGLFPEHLTYGRRLVSPGFYAVQGRRSYYLAAESEYDRETVVLRKLSDHFETCVSGLNRVKAYIHDPFFQYMFREFGIT